jgi:hypothetical protein
MARNDIEIALRDGIAAAQDDRPDFAYSGRDTGVDGVWPPSLGGWLP